MQKWCKNLSLWLQYWYRLMSPPLLRYGSNSLQSSCGAILPRIESEGFLVNLLVVSGDLVSSVGIRGTLYIALAVLKIATMLGWDDSPCRRIPFLSWTRWKDSSWGEVVVATSDEFEIESAEEGIVRDVYNDNDELEDHVTQLYRKPKEFENLSHIVLVTHGFILTRSDLE